MDAADVDRQRSMLHRLANELQNAVYYLEEANDLARRLPTPGAVREHLSEALAALGRGVDATHDLQQHTRATLVGAAAPAGEAR